MNKIRVLTFGLIASFAFVAIASATTYSSVAFIFSQKGEYKDKVNSLAKGNDRLTVVVTSKKDATLGLSLSKKGLFGYSFISRCNMPINDAYKVMCTWENQASGTYKGTTVVNTLGTDFTGSIDGEMYLSDQV